MLVKTNRHKVFIHTYFIYLQQVSIPKYHYQGAVHMLKLQAN